MSIVSTRVPAELVGMAVLGLVAWKFHWYSVAQGIVKEHPVTAVLIALLSESVGNEKENSVSDNVDDDEFLRCD